MSDPRFCSSRVGSCTRPAGSTRPRTRRSLPTPPPPCRWGLFEDSPEKLLRDLAKTRPGKLLQGAGRGPKHFEHGDLDAAEKLTDRAERMHGGYSIWDLGDRPQKLRAEIEVARAKSHKTELPPPVPEAVAQKKPAEKVASAAPKGPASTDFTPRPGLWAPSPFAPSAPVVNAGCPVGAGREPAGCLVGAGREPADRPESARCGGGDTNGADPPVEDDRAASPQDACRGPRSPACRQHDVGLKAGG